MGDLIQRKRRPRATTPTAPFLSINDAFGRLDAVLDILPEDHRLVLVRGSHDPTSSDLSAELLCRDLRDHQIDVEREHAPLSFFRQSIGAVHYHQPARVAEFHELERIGAMVEFTAFVDADNEIP